MRTRKWQDEETGADRYTTEIGADTMRMLGSRGDAGAPRQDKDRETDPWERNPSKVGDALGLIGSRDDYPF